MATRPTVAKHPVTDMPMMDKTPQEEDGVVSLCMGSDWAAKLAAKEVVVMVEEAVEEVDKERPFTHTSLTLDEEEHTQPTPT